MEIRSPVVICLKISIFVVSNTTPSDGSYYRFSCDLLENFYLCGIKHNPIKKPNNRRQLWFAWKFLSLWYQTQLIKHIKANTYVVICLKISIFVVSNTTRFLNAICKSRLWFAWKFLSLWYQTQPDQCNMLDNSYLQRYLEK